MGKFMGNLAKKKILLGICGGIAAYKACELTRFLRTADAEVQVVVTSHAKQFITPLTLETLSGRLVYSDLFENGFESNIGHIQLARWADIIMIAPASANFLARLSHGISDDLLTTLCLATSAPIVLVPAMNKYMWHNAATQNNIEILKKRGLHFVGPDEGEQACGDVGLGRMIEPIELLSFLENFFVKPIFQGKKVMITAGPTREAIDPVRYMSNRSSGKMGYAIADAMAKSGAEVLLISGPTYLDCPHKVSRIQVISAADMYEAVMQNLPCDIFISVAAVSDYRPETYHHSKIKRNSDELSLKLVKNPDLLSFVEHTHPRPYIVGFCAETDNHLNNAKEKLKKKNIDMLVLNPIENDQSFEVDHCRATILTQEGGQIELPELTKIKVAQQLTAHIGKEYFRELIG
jgi:phosphopantothenoylcysteine decarboxylase / phosphopantothenate---cysteine ligase